jgi:hypothetical protein
MVVKFNTVNLNADDDDDDDDSLNSCSDSSKEDESLACILPTDNFMMCVCVWGGI